MRYKGKKLYNAIDDYVVFDFETTGLYLDGDCRIIEISALKIRSNEVIDTFTTLINPEIKIPYSATQINNITDDMVSASPVIEDIFDEFIEFIGDDVLIGHNIDTFDYNILYDLYMRFKNKPFQNTYIDTFHLAKRCLPELENFRLSTLAEHLNIDIYEAHRAESDCYTANQLYQQLKPLISDDYSCTVAINKNKNQYAVVSYSEGLKNIFYGTTCIVYGGFKQMDSDKIKSLINTLGAEYIDYFCYSADYLILGDEMYSKYVKRVPDELIDSVIWRTNIRVLSEYEFVRYSDIIITTESNQLDIDFKFDVSDKKICLTGEFACGDREKISNTLIAKGAIIKPNVIKKLDYLIVGSLGNPDWKDGRGSKYLKATDYNRNGSNIAIIDENNFIINEVNINGTAYLL